MKSSRVGPAAVCAALSFIATDALAGFQRVEMQVPGNVLWVTHGDLDGDKMTDIVASYRRGSGLQAARYIAVFFQTPKGYRGRPDIAFRAPRSAAMFDLGDAFGDGKDSILYLSSTGVFAQAFNARKPAKPQKIADGRNLIGRPEEDDLPAWDFLRVVEGQPLLIMPTRAGLTLFRRTENRWKPTSIRIDNLSYYDAETPTYRRSARGGSSGRPYALRVTTTVPNLDFVDQNGDGRLDLVTHYQDRFAVYLQLDDHSYSSKPIRQWLKMRTKQEAETKDSSVSAQIADFDGDGRADVCLTKIAGGMSNLRTELHFHRGAKGGGFDARPAQVLSDEGFGALVRFVDLDGDGALEMVQPHSSVSIIGITQMLLSSKLSMDVRLRRRSRAAGFFAPKPFQELETSFGLDLSVGASVRGAAPIFGYDFDGDGRRDALLSEGGEKMVLHRGKADGEFEDSGNVSLSAAGSNLTVVLPRKPGKNAKPDVLVYYVSRQGLSGKLVLFRNTF